MVSFVGHTKRTVYTAFILLSFAASCPAATILQLRFSELCQRSVIIFEGRVSHIQSYQADTSRVIRTVVTFDVIDPIKGENIGETIELTYLGGTVGDLTLKVEDLRMPEMHETGIYFVETREEGQVNPLTGWSQGHFLVELDDTDIKRILTADFRPIYSIDPAYEESRKGISTGLALGAQADDNIDLTKALSAAAFKDIVKERLSE